MTTPPPAAAGSVDIPQPHRSSGGRLPSLNQLAARININANSHNTNNTTSTNTSTTSATSRPRLAASVLRTGIGSVSTTSLSTTSSTIDSMAANAPSTRSVSPSSTTTPPLSLTPSIPEDGPAPDPLTAEKLERLNQETERKVKVGYKNIPSLDAITQRLAKARSLSVDGSAKPPEAEMIEDPKTPGVAMKAPEHPLQYNWTVYHDTKAKAPFTPAPPGQTQGAPVAPADGPGSAFSVVDTGEYEAGLTVIGEFDTVESFCRYFNWLKPPSKLERNSNYHLFKTGIKPMWEDEANANGGKWVLTMKNNPALLDRCWSWLAMALVGEELEEGDEICGAVVSLRSKVDRIQVWTRSKEDVERLNGIGKKLVKLLDVSEADGIGLEFQYNTEDRPFPNKFLSIQALPQTSYRSTFQPGHSHSRSGGRGETFATSPTDSGPPSAGLTSGGQGGAFGNFGVGGIGGGGGGGGNWKAGKRS